jgi:hypothetical protein
VKGDNMTRKGMKNALYILFYILKMAIALKVIALYIFAAGFILGFLL